MTQIVAQPKDLSIFVQRLCADELLAELRRGVWQPIKPKLLLEPPSFSTPGGVAIQVPAYLTAIVNAHPGLGNDMLEVAIMRRDYQDALNDIDSLGLGEVWDKFFRTKQRLYRVETRTSKFRVGEQYVVGQNRRTGRAERTAMNAIWSRAVVRDYIGPVCVL